MCFKIYLFNLSKVKILAAERPKTESELFKMFAATKLAKKVDILLFLFIFTYLDNLGQSTHL